MGRGRAQYSPVKPVLVTGAPRSGTTWIGQMLASAAELNYIHEPFNPAWQIAESICNKRFDQFFTYICEDNETEYILPIKQMVQGKYDWKLGLLRSNSIKDIKKHLHNWRTFYKHRKAGGVPLIKDPIALMSAEWLADRFNINIVVIIRHPCAFVSSLLRGRSICAPRAAGR